MLNNINIEFFDEYKRLDKLCSEIYDQSSGGITSYINDMESVSSFEAQKILGWNSTYNKLKSLRHIRNQMAHGEGSFGDYECSYDDVEWLRDFYSKIMNVSDPLAIYRKNMKIEKQLQNKKPYKQSSENLSNESGNDMYFGKNNSPEGLDFKFILVILLVAVIFIVIFIMIIGVYCDI